MAVTTAGCADPLDSESPGGTNTDQPAVGVKVVSAWTSPVRESIRLIGTTRAIESVNITAEVGGRVEWIGFDDEQMVETGDLLLRLDTRRAEADLRFSLARLDRLNLSLERISAAFENGAANQSELDDIRTAVREAQADVDLAQIALDDHEIRAPFAGRVTRRFVSLGALITPGTSITVLNAVDPVEVVFAVPERQLSDIQTGQSVAATFAPFPQTSFTGTLVTTGAVVDQSTRAAEVFARLDNPDALLRPGMFATVQLTTGVRENAVLVPESALLTEGTRVEAFVVEDGKAQRRRVEIAQRHRGIVEITRGISAGDVIVTAGIQKLRDGTPVDTSPDRDLANLGVIPGLPLDEQPILFGHRFTGEVDPQDGGG